MMSKHWIVKVRIEGDDPLVFGPYSQAQAEKLAEKVNQADSEKQYDEYRHAVAVPMVKPAGILALLAEVGLL